MKFRSKFRGTCRVCGETINKGEFVEWYRGAGAAHLKCVQHWQRRTLESNSPSQSNSTSQEVVKSTPNIIDYVTIILPLSLCSVAVFTDFKTAFVLCHSLPYILSLFNGGLIPTEGRQRVGFGSRRQYRYDLMIIAITFLAVLSIIPGSLVCFIKVLLFK